MRNILLLFARYGAHLLFVGLEIICFYLVVNYNKSQKDIFLNSSLLFAGKLNEKVDNARDYFYLQEVNDSLQKENSRLLRQVINTRLNSNPPAPGDSVLHKFNIIPVTICGNSINKRYNYITLCAGKDKGIQKGMGVVTDKGAVGIIRHATSGYSVVLPLTNGLSRLSCLVKNKNFLGTLLWKDNDPMQMKLEDVPKHAHISIGDTIITSGYSTVFPRGIEIGTISNFTADKGSATYIVDVRLWEDISRLEYAYVMENKHREELDSLTNMLINE